ncbi:MAG: YjfB family protein [Betaproteobacteria bacterium]|nr:YjfB family protein [Betaproteobacteria bacterium]
MDTASLSNALASQVSAQSNPSATSVVVLRKALNLEAQSAAALINALPRPTSPQNLPSHLGQNVNTTA